MVKGIVITEKQKKQAIAEFKRNFGNFKGFIRKEWEII